MSRLTIYCPDIECDSCVKVISKTLDNLEGISKYRIARDSIVIEYVDHLIKPETFLNAIRSKGYRASFSPVLKKTIGERVTEFITDKKKYLVEYKLLRYSVITLLLVLLMQLMLGYSISKYDPEFLSTYGIWLFYLSVGVVSLVGSLWHLKAYRVNVTTMVGMMIGMTIGMQTGLLVGYVIGAVNGFFVGALTGMIIGTTIGAVAGYCCGIMGAMEGMMAGIMGGTMGAMIGVMMSPENIFWFTPFYFLCNIAVLMGLSYMLFEEAIEDKVDVPLRRVTFIKFLTTALVVTLVLDALMLLAPASVFLR